jgi:hypothetical protein
MNANYRYEARTVDAIVSALMKCSLGQFIDIPDETFSNSISFRPGFYMLLSLDRVAMPVV